MKIIAMIVLAYFSLFCLGCANTPKQTKGECLEKEETWIEKSFIIKDIKNTP